MLYSELTRFPLESSSSFVSAESLYKNQTSFDNSTEESIVINPFNVALNSVTSEAGKDETVAGTLAVVNVLVSPERITPLARMNDL